MEKLVELNTQLMSAPAGVLIILFTFAIGHGLKKTEKFSNKNIPIILLTIGCVLWMFCACATFPEAGTNFRKVMPWLGTNICIGFTLPCISWMMHRIVWKYIEKKYGLEGFNTAEFVKPKDETTPTPKP